MIEWIATAPATDPAGAARGLSLVLWLGLLIVVLVTGMFLIVALRRWAMPDRSSKWDFARPPVRDAWSEAGKRAQAYEATPRGPQARPRDDDAGPPSANGPRPGNGPIPGGPGPRNPA